MAKDKNTTVPEGLEPESLPDMAVDPEVEKSYKAGIRTDLVNRYRQQEIMMNLYLKTGDKASADTQAESLRNIVIMVKAIDNNEV